MTTVTKMNADAEPMLDLESIKSEIAELKSSLSALASKAKSDVSDDVASARDVVEHFSDEAAQAYKNLTKRGAGSAKAIGRYVKGKPTMSLLVAFAIGVIGSRLLAR